jgi:hypothetical protein
MQRRDIERRIAELERRPQGLSVDEVRPHHFFESMTRNGFRAPPLIDGESTTSYIHRIDCIELDEFVRAVVQRRITA